MDSTCMCPCCEAKAPCFQCATPQEEEEEQKKLINPQTPFSIAYVCCLINIGIPIFSFTISEEIFISNWMPSCSIFLIVNSDHPEYLLICNGCFVFFWFPRFALNFKAWKVIEFCNKSYLFCLFFIPLIMGILHISAEKKYFEEIIFFIENSILKQSFAQNCFFPIKMDT